MVLIVPFEGFPAAAKTFGAKEVFVSPRGTGTMITVAKPDKAWVLSAISPDPLAAVEKLLKADGFAVSQGLWTHVAESTTLAGHPIQEAFIAAVSYKCDGPKQGLWMDAYPSRPTDQIVLRAMYDEFIANEEIDAVGYEEFLVHAKPNVVILGPDEIATFLMLKQDC